MPDNVNRPITILPYQHNYKITCNITTSSTAIQHKAVNNYNAFQLRLYVTADKSLNVST